MKKEYPVLVVQYGKDITIELLDIRYKRPHIKRSPNSGETCVSHEMSRLKYKGNAFPYFTPNSVSISLALVDESLGQINNTKKEIDAFLSGKRDIKSELVTHLKNNTEHLINYIQAVQKGVIFSYSAFESFLNLLLPEDIVWEENDNKGIKKVYNKETIQRWTDNRKKIRILDSKFQFLESIPPAIQEDYKTLEDLRNRIIHRKAGDDEEIIAAIFRKGIFSVVNSVFVFVNLILEKIGNSIDHEHLMLLPVLSHENQLSIELSENYRVMSEEEAKQFLE